MTIRYRRRKSNRQPAQPASHQPASILNGKSRVSPVVVSRRRFTKVGSTVEAFSNRCGTNEVLVPEFRTVKDDRNAAPVTTVSQQNVMKFAFCVKSEAPLLTKVRLLISRQAERAILETTASVCSVINSHRQYPLGVAEGVVLFVDNALEATQCRLKDALRRDGSPSDQVINQPIGAEFIDVSVPNLSLPAQVQCAESMNLVAIRVCNPDQPGRKQFVRQRVGMNGQYREFRRVQ